MLKVINHRNNKIPVGVYWPIRLKALRRFKKRLNNSLGEYIWCVIIYDNQMYIVVYESYPDGIRNLYEQLMLTDRTCILTPTGFHWKPSPKKKKCQIS